MNKKIMALLIGVLAILPVVALAIGPYESLEHRQDGVSSDGSTHVLAGWLEDALEIKNKDGEVFVQWFRGEQYVCQCTEGMNPDAVASKLSEGWTLWPPETTDPRFDWCPNHEFIYRMT